MLGSAESTILIGHPFPLKGRYAAYIFIHFEPTGHSLGRNESGYFYLRHEDHDEDAIVTRSSRGSSKKANLEYRKSAKEGHGGQSASMDSSLPPYIKRTFHFFLMAFRVGP